MKDQETLWSLVKILPNWFPINPYEANKQELAMFWLVCMHGLCGSAEGKPVDV